MCPVHRPRGGVAYRALLAPLRLLYRPVLPHTEGGINYVLSHRVGSQLVSPCNTTAFIFNAAPLVARIALNVAAQAVSTAPGSSPTQSIHCASRHKDGQTSTVCFFHNNRILHN